RLQQLRRALRQRDAGLLHLVLKAGDDPLHLRGRVLTEVADEIRGAPARLRNMHQTPVILLLRGTRLGQLHTTAALKILRVRPEHRRWRPKQKMGGGLQGVRVKAAGESGGGLRRANRDTVTSQLLDGALHALLLPHRSTSAIAPAALWSASSASRASLEAPAPPLRPARIGVGAARAAARAHARCDAPARSSPPQTRWQRCPAADLPKVATRTAGVAPTAPRIRSASAAPPQATSTPQPRPPRPLRASRPMTTGRGRHRAAKNLPPY